MKEQYILAPGCNGTELLRTLARFGVDTMGLRVISAAELAKTALIRSGVSIGKEFLSRKEEPPVFDSFLREIPYFMNASYADSENLSDAVFSMRSLISGEDEKKAIHEKLSQGVFEEKNKAIEDAYIRFINKCSAEKIIDTVSLIRLAIEKSKVNLPVRTLLQYPCSPLEEELVRAVGGGTSPKISMEVIFNNTDKISAVKDYMEAYGAVNEVEDILQQIYNRKLPLDECTVVCSGGEVYPQLFFDFSRRYGISTTFEMGVPISNSYPAMLLKLMAVWDREGYHGVDALKNLILSQAFNRKKLAEVIGENPLSEKKLRRFIEICGNLRLSFDGVQNRKRIETLRDAFKKGTSMLDTDEEEYLVFAEKFSGELEKGCIEFIRNFAFLRSEEAARVDQSAFQVIIEGLLSYARFSGYETVMEIVPELLNKTVCSEMRREGILHIASIPGAFSSIRKNLFICGLSAAEFPGSPTENYLLLDKDLIAFDSKAVTSDKRINEKKERFEQLLALGEKIGAEIHLSYSDYDLSELKDRNPSSVLYQVYMKENLNGNMDSFREAFRSVGYFDTDISAARKIGKAYGEGKTFNAASFCKKETPVDLSARRWSPSALDMFFDCPRRFYLTRVLGIEEKEEDDPFRVVNPYDPGRIAHKAMEKLDKKKMSEIQFLTVCGELFDGFLAGRPPMHEDAALRERENFLEMMKTAYSMDPGNEVLMAEEDIEGIHPAGIILHGYPDRVEKTKDGLKIVDFKTGRTTSHVENDVDTCLQALIYAWIMEKKGKKVSGCEYRYLRKNSIIPCVYDDDMKKRLEEKLKVFKEAIDSNSFPRTPGKDACKHCKQAAICMFPGDETEENA